MATVPAPPAPTPAHQWRQGESPWLDAWGSPGARCRVIIDNDFAGDPDDLIQLVHHLLSPTVHVDLIVSSHLRVGHSDSTFTASEGAGVARAALARMGLIAPDLVATGAECSLADASSPEISEATDRIVAASLAEDPRPLFYVAGGGLTDLASALMLHPEIAGRMTLVWIGGFEHDIVSPNVNDEYNVSIDVAAAQVVFDAEGLEIWQVPRTVYSICVMSDAQMILHLAAAGPLGAFLRDEVHAEMRRFAEPGRAPAETYTMGDSPLVLLTALTNYWAGDSDSSAFEVKPTPALAADGGYRERPQARPMRLYSGVDVGLLFADFTAKIELFERWQRS